MLGGMRAFVKSKWAIGLFALLIVSFGIFGFSDPFAGVSGGGFVQVGNREIRPRDVNRQVDLILERIRRERNEILSARDAAQQGITQEVLQQEVRRVLTAEFGKKIGVEAGEASVTSLINQTPGFKDALGRLSMQQVEAEARARGMTVAEFESFLRDSLTNGYIEGAVEAALVTPEVLTKPLITFSGETRTLSLARVAPEAIPQPKLPTDEELRTFYGQNSARFQQPERRRVSMLLYSPDDFTDKVELKPEEVRAEYDDQIRKYSSPETRAVTQYTAADRNSLQTFVDLVKSGKTAEEALKQSPAVSKVELSVKPGDLTDEQYDQFVFSLPMGALQGPVKLTDAFYAVEVKSVTPGVPTPFEQVADQVRTDLARAEAQRLFNNSEESFYDMAGGISLEEIGKNIGAPIIQLDAVDSNGATKSGLQSQLLARHPEAVRSLFGLSAGQATDVIEGDNERGLFRVDEIVAAHTLPFEEVADDVHQIYLRQKMQEASEKMANDMVAAVKGGMAFDKAATANKLAVLGQLPVIRAANSPIDQNVRATAFNLANGDVAVARDAQGNPWVVKVDKIEPLTPELETQLRAQITEEVGKSLTNDIREVYIRGLQAAVKVKPNEKAVEAYFDNLTKEEAQ
jgi:peptidyl-prolyl cis-trans isomerase D